MKKPEDNLNKIIVAATIIIICASINIGYQLAKITQ
jgi:hypothetical protein